MSRKNILKNILVSGVVIIGLLGGTIATIISWALTSLFELVTSQVLWSADLFIAKWYKLVPLLILSGMFLVSYHSFQEYKKQNRK